MGLVSILEKAQPMVKEKIGGHSYDTWFANLHIKEYNPTTLVIETPDDFYKNWIIDHYLTTIQEYIVFISKTPIHLKFEVNATMLASQPSILVASNHEKPYPDNSLTQLNLNP